MVRNSLNVLPRFSLDNTPYQGLIHAVFCSKSCCGYSANGIATTDDSHIIGCQFSQFVRFTTIERWCLSVLVAIRMLLTASAPFCAHVAGIVCLRSQEQMCRLSTRRIVAMMKNEQSIRDRSVCQFVRHSVCVNTAIVCVGVPNIDLAVAALRPSASPLKASIGLPSKLRPETSRIQGHRVSPHSVSRPRSVDADAGVLHVNYTTCLRVGSA